jgi:bifunctional non-homologous end joining protein LigD
MPKRRFEPCLPARQTRVPTGADWIHEIKQDGYRLIVQLDALHSGRHNDEVQFYAFDMLAGDGEDLRKLPLSMRKANLQRLLARRPEGIFIAPFEQGEIGPDLFRKACEFGLERRVSKHRDRAYRAGRSPNWVKVKNPEHPAMTRDQKAFA